MQARTRNLVPEPPALPLQPGEQALLLRRTLRNNSEVHPAHFRLSRRARTPERSPKVHQVEPRRASVDMQVVQRSRHRCQAVRHRDGGQAMGNHPVRAGRQAARQSAGSRRPAAPGFRRIPHRQRREACGNRACQSARTGMRSSDVQARLRVFIPAMRSFTHVLGRRLGTNEKILANPLQSIQHFRLRWRSFVSPGDCRSSFGSTARDPAAAAMDTRRTGGFPEPRVR